MSKHWLVHRDGQTYGPYDAAQLRAQLRDGTLDPFDLISQEGSVIKQELVEVDEVFDEDNALSFAESPQEMPLAAGQSFHPNSNPTLAAAPENSHAFVPDLGRTQTMGGGNLAAPMEHLPALKKTTPASGPQPFNQPIYSTTKRNPKKYQIIDPKGRVLGPLSAGEIQSLFYKGVLPASVMVMKLGRDSKVPIQKFIAVYSRSKQHKVKQGAHPQMGMPNSVKLNQMAQAQRAAMAAKRGVHEGLIMWFLVAVILLGGGYIAVDYFGLDFGLSKRKPVRTKVIKKKPKKKPAKPAYKSGKLPRPKAFVKKTKPAPRKVKPRSVRKPVPKRSKPKKSVYRPKPRVNTPRTAYRPSRVVYQRTRRPSPPPAPRQSVASLKPGMNVSGLGPMIFNPAQITKCQVKCVVVMSGSGGTVVAKFFKQHYGAKLLQRSKGAFISGLVQKTGGKITILLNGVR